MATPTTPAQNNQATGKQPEFAIQRIYLKDLSFEAPHTPEIFRGEWKPEVKFELNTSNKHLGETNYEVTLAVTVTATIESKVAFLVEVKQCGIFSITGVAMDQLDGLLGSFCPNIIFPYLREVISDVVTRGSFPQLYLAPINFDAIYAEHLKQKQTGDKKGSTEVKTH